MMNIPVDQLARGGQHVRSELEPSTSLQREECGDISSALSSGQRSIWLVQQANPQSPCFNLVCSLTLRGDVHLAALGRALRRLWISRPILRSTFNDDDGQPALMIRTPDGWHAHLEDAVHWNEEEWTKRWGELSDAPFDLRRGPLFRAVILQRNVDCCVVHIAVHHVIADFWSLPLMIRELLDFYRADCDGRALPSRESDTTFFDFIQSQQNWLDGPEANQHAEYWRRHLCEADTLLALPTDRPIPARRPAEGAAYRHLLDPSLVSRLRQCAKREQVTPYVFCLTAFYAFLHRHSGQNELVVATPTLGRNESRWSEVLGNFANPLALRVHCGNDRTFRELLHEVRDAVRNGLLHGDYPFAEVIETVNPKRSPGRPLLAQVMLAWERVQQFEGAKLDRFSDGPTTVELDDFGLEVEIDIERRRAPFELTLQVHEQLGLLKTRWQYATALFDAATVRRFAERYTRILAAATDDPAATIGELPILADEEASVLTAFACGKYRDYEQDVCLHELIARRAAAAPNDVAVRYRDVVVTYRELHERSARVAALLTAHGAGPDIVIGVAMTRSVEMVVAMLGVMQAGAAYMPIDPEGPRDRTTYQLKEAGVSTIVTQKAYADAWGAAYGVLALDDPQAVARFAAECVATTPRRSQPRNLAYVLYTSGSTGRPKGVMIEHRAIVNRLLWMQEEYGLTKSDRVLQKTPVTFDVSVWELFWPLIVGAELVVAEPHMHRDAGYLARVIAEREITTMHFVPTMLRAFLDHPSLPRFASLKRVFASGEALAPDLVDRFHNCCDADLHNLYGPTEAAVDVTFHRCRRGGSAATVPIGRPIANMQTLVLDIHRQVQPIGVAGELYLGGVGLARGYVNQSELTAEKFVPHPWRAGDRLYRTGDLCRWTADGELEFLGRLDDQIKLAGNRIEIGEIENVLSAHDDVAQAAVVVRPSDAGPRLAAYVVAAAGSQLDLTDLRRYLSSKLPAYMVPAVIVSIAELPIGSSGKIDRNALPEPPRLRDDVNVPYVAPLSFGRSTCRPVCGSIGNRSNRRPR